MTNSINITGFRITSETNHWVYQRERFSSAGNSTLDPVDSDISLGDRIKQGKQERHQPDLLFPDSWNVINFLGVLPPCLPLKVK